MMTAMGAEPAGDRPVLRAVPEHGLADHFALSSGKNLTADGQSRRRKHSGHFGLRAWQIGPAVLDEEEVEIEPVLLGDEGHEVALDLDRVLLPAQSEPPRQAPGVGVDGDPLGLAVAGREDDVGRLAGDARKRHELRHGVRDDAAIGLDDPLRRPDDVLGLHPEEPRRMDHPLELGPVGPGEGRGRRVFPEELRGHRVDQLVGALGGQDRGHEDLERIAVLEGGPGMRVALPEQADDRLDAQPRSVHDGLPSGPLRGRRERDPGRGGSPRRVVIGELADEVDLGADHGLMAPLDPAEIGQDPASGLVLHPLRRVAVIGFGDLLGLEGRFEQGRNVRVGGEGDADRRHQRRLRDVLRLVRVPLGEEVLDDLPVVFLLEGQELQLLDEEDVLDPSLEPRVKGGGVDLRADGDAEDLPGREILVDGHEDLLLKIF